MESSLYIKSAKHLHDFVLEVEFTNDCTKIVDVKEIIERCKPMHKYLSNKDEFGKFKVERGVIIWDGWIDIAPESIYLAGKWKFVAKGSNFKEPSYISHQA